MPPPPLHNNNRPPPPPPPFPYYRFPLLSPRPPLLKQSRLQLPITLLPRYRSVGRPGPLIKPKPSFSIHCCIKMQLRLSVDGWPYQASSSTTTFLLFFFLILSHDLFLSFSLFPKISSHSSSLPESITISFDKQRRRRRLRLRRCNNFSSLITQQQLLRLQQHGTHTLTLPRGDRERLTSSHFHPIVLPRA